MHPESIKSERKIKLLMAQFESVKKSLHVLLPRRYFKLQSWMRKWQKKIVIALNNWEPCQGHPQLYIWGPSRCGKTKFIEYLFSAERENGQIFTPHVLDNGSISSYQYEGFDERKHTLTIADEFNWTRMNIDQWRKASENMLLTQERKYKDPMTFRMNGFYIMISNLPPESYRSLNKEGYINDSIENRIHVIKCKRFEGSDHFLSLMKNKIAGKLKFLLKHVNIVFIFTTIKS